jgi:hypothetical protein
MCHVIYLSTHLFLYPYISPSTRPSSLQLFIVLSIYLYIHHFSIYISTYQYIHSNLMECNKVRILHQRIVGLYHTFVTGFGETGRVGLSLLSEGLRVLLAYSKTALKL